MPEQPLHLRALCEYDGTDYYGFQIQADKPTIQGKLEAVLARLTGESVRIRYAGRTDAGVHAEGQVIAFHAKWRHPICDLERACNALLPSDIAIRSLEQVVDPRFHPRFSAYSRVYRYRVWTAAWRSPLHDRLMHHESRPLDLEAMNGAANLLLGQQDFASFGQPTQGESTVRKVYAAIWQRGEEHVIQFEIEANAFLRRMVRSVVGTLLEIGLELRAVSDLHQILAARNRALAARPAPAKGLCLVKVNYRATSKSEQGSAQRAGFESE